MFTKIVAGNPVEDYVNSVLLIVGAWLLLQVLRRLVFSQLKKLAAKTNTSFDDVLITVAEKYVAPFAFFLITYHVLKQLHMPHSLRSTLRIAIGFITLYYSVRFLIQSLRTLLLGFMRSRGESEERIRQITGIMIVFNMSVWVLGLVLFLNNLGYNVTAIITGLGVGGIAIALAAQAVLGDLFSYFVIFFDKPFEIGDSIAASGKDGTIEYIGIKTTRIRSINGEQLIVPNTELTKAVVHNYKRMERRRVLFTLKVVHQTNPEKLEKVIPLVQGIIAKQNVAEFDRGHLKELADSSINFEFVYFVKPPDYKVYMDTQQAILFDIISALNKEEIRLAYPTATAYNYTVQN